MECKCKWTTDFGRLEHCTSCQLIGIIKAIELRLEEQNKILEKLGKVIARTSKAGW